MLKWTAVTIAFLICGLLFYWTQEEMNILIRSALNSHLAEQQIGQFLVIQRDILREHEDRVAKLEDFQKKVQSLIDHYTKPADPPTAQPEKPTSDPPIKKASPRKPVHRTSYHSLPKANASQEFPIILGIGY